MGAIIAVLIALTIGHHHHHHNHHHHHARVATGPAPIVLSEVGQEITEEWPENPATPQEIEEQERETERENEWP